MAISAVILTRTGTAAAQNADAEFLFSEAVRFEAADKVPEACDAFEASNRIEPRAGTLIRLGQCREKQGRRVSAWSAYRDSLSRVKDPGKRKLAEARIAALEPTLSYLTVSVPDDARVDSLVVTRNGATLEPILWNRAVPVDAGSYTIAGSAPGHESWQTTVEVGPIGDKVSVELPRFKAIQTLVVPPPGTGTSQIKQPIDEPPPRRDDAPSRLTGKRKLALGLGAVGLAAIAGGVVLGAQARGLEGDAFALCPDPMVTCADSIRAQELSDRGASRALYANIAYGVGAGAVIGAAVLWFTGGPPKRDRLAVTLLHGSGVTGAVARIGF